MAEHTGGKGRHAAVCCLLSMLAAAGLLCSLSTDPYFIADEALAEKGTVCRFFMYCVRSFSVDVETASCIALAAGILLYFAPRLRFTAAERRMSLCFGILFSIMQILGRSYVTYRSWDAVFATRFTVFRGIVVLAGRTVFSACLVLYGFRLLDHAAKPAQNSSPLSLRRFFPAAGAVALCWLPYYLLFFPGLGNPDTSMQIAWFMHCPTEWLQFSAVRGPDIYATNHHPYFTTVLYGLFAKLGLWMGNVGRGVALYCLLQMLLMALALTGVWFYLRRIGLREKYCRAGLVFTALFPLYPLYAITMLKDTLFSLFCLTFSVLLFEIVRTGGDSLRSGRFCAAAAANALLVMLTKNQGVYIAAAAAAVCLVVCRRRLRTAAALALPVLFFQLVWIQVLLPAWNVAPGGKQEVLSLLFQQTARCVVTYPEDVTEEEAGAIRAVIDYDNLPELYTPNYSDPVKFTYNQDATDEELSAYYRVWLAMFHRHPDAYFQAFLHNMYGSFYLGRETDLSYTDFDNRGAEGYPHLYVEKTALLERVQPTVKTLLRAVQHLPGIGLLFRIGGYPWAILFIFLDTLRRRRYTWILPEVPAVLSVAVLFLAPVSGSYRYAMPLFFMIPFLLCLCLLRETPSAADAAGPAA